MSKNGCYQAKILKVGDKEVLTTEVTYEDLKILYQQYIDTYGKVPTFNKCDSKHNMPQGRIINRVLKEQGVTYNEFLNMFGKYGRVRTESKDYNLFVKKYIDKSNELGHYIYGKDLVNNSYGLPGERWFVNYCPDKNVKTFTDFVKWCGFEPDSVFDKEYVGKKLIELEKKLGRHITRNDITIDNVGFSMIVIVRLFGGLNNAKEELGLMDTPPVQPRPFEFYKEQLKGTLEAIYKNTGRKFVCWGDIENTEYNGMTVEHKTYTKSFRRNNENVFAYVKSLGFEMNMSQVGSSYVFDDGELVKSTYEYDFSTFLRENNIPYVRNVKYSTFSDEKSRIDCDYRIDCNGKYLYIEIAGLIYNSQTNDWKERTYSDDRCNTYKEKMIKKEEILFNSKVDFIFLFPYDMMSNHYKDIVTNKINELSREVA